MLLLALVAVLAPHSPTSDVVPEPAARAIPWDARAVEHLLNRAGFGANQSEIERGLALGPERLVDELLAAREAWVEVEPQLFHWEDFGLDHMQVTLASSPYHTLDQASQVGMCKDARVVDRNQFLAVLERWFGSIARGDDPLRDRATLFWHGYFTTSWEVVKRKYEIVRQFHWLRRDALTNCSGLVRGIVRDPAMLQYLDQTASSRELPNENLARELLELFTLGEGEFDERDVREAARALTGNRCTSGGAFERSPDAHDDGPKTILGRTARFDDQELVDHVLAQEACPRWFARRLLRWFEGMEPDEVRIARYAQLLRDERFELRPFLRALFLDPRFYSSDVVGARVLAPLEYLAFACRKLEIEPGGHFLNKAGVILGQAFYWPPSVKGWPEGLDWITNDALNRRGNVLGALLGLLEAAPDDAASVADGAQPDPASERMRASDGADEVARLGLSSDLGALVRTHARAPWAPSAVWLERLARSGARADDEVIAWLLEEWLPGPPARSSREIAVRWLASERSARGLEAGAWLDEARVRDELLRKLAHLVLSLPEAHLG